MNSGTAKNTRDRPGNLRLYVQNQKNVDSGRVTDRSIGIKQDIIPEVAFDLNASLLEEGCPSWLVLNLLSFLCQFFRLLFRFMNDGI